MRKVTRRQFCQVAAATLTTGGCIDATARARGGGLPTAHEGGIDRPAALLNKDEQLRRFHFWQNRDWRWYRQNIPFFESPNPVIDEIYYYRWEVVTRHLRYTSPEYGYVCTEFLPVHADAWAGRYGAISAAADLQMDEMRWLRETGPARDFLRYFLTVPGAQPRAYGFAPTWVGYRLSAANGAPHALVDLLPQCVANYQAWERGVVRYPEDNGFDPIRGLFWNTGRDVGGEMNLASAQLSETLRGIPGYKIRGGAGYRPEANAILFGEAQAIAELAHSLGESAIAASFAVKAAALKRNVQAQLWDPEREFFMHRWRYNEYADGDTAGHKSIRADSLLWQTNAHCTGVGFQPEQDGKGKGRELSSYHLWRYGLPDDNDDANPQNGYARAWRFLTSPHYFAGRFGPATGEKGDPWFSVIYGECRFNGQTWPFHTSRLLAGALNLLRNYRHHQFFSREDWMRLFEQYTQMHRNANQPFIAESHDPDKEQWTELRPPGFHYMHSSFVDLVVTGLVGVHPRTDNILEIDPMARREWDYFAVDELSYRGHTLTIFWDRTGEREAANPLSSCRSSGVSSRVALGRPRDISKPSCNPDLIASYLRDTTLAPGHYRITAAHAGFGSMTQTFTLAADENRNIALNLPVGSAVASVTVASQAPLLDTSDSRNQLTLSEEDVQSLPLPGRNATILTLLAPGVTGRGPGYGSSGNFATESNDISANGGGDNGNDYILDGLDLNLSVNAGTTGLVPNPDALSQITVETNTYSSDYGRVAAVQTVFTSKAGTTHYHGFASEYYSYQGLDAKGEFFPANTTIEPFHTNNLSFGIGGPILPRKQLFGFFSIEPYRSLTSNGTSVTQVEDPRFVAFAQQVRPNSPELTLFTDLPPTGATVTGVASTAQSQFGATNAALGTGCATASADNIPCSLPVTDNAVFNSSSFTNAQQWNLRVDKYFGEHDRVYGTIFRVSNTNGSPAIRPLQANDETIRNIFYQLNETHTFNASTLNEAFFGVANLNYNEYVPQNPALYKYPYVTVTGLPQSFGLNEINFLYGETNYHWRDVLTHIVGSHSIKAGYEWYRGTDPANLAVPYSQPNLTYTNLINFINDDIYSEGNLAYNPLTGAPEAARYNYGIISQGAFVEDTWKATKTLTVNYGVRWDNEGNAYPLAPSTFVANFHLAPGSTFEQQVANGVMTQQGSLLNHDLQPVFSPRGGVAWDPTGTGKWVLRGGVGVFRDWVTLGNEVTKILSNPPDYVQPTFKNDGSTVGRPIFGFGTQTSYPLGFPYPKLQAGALNAQGGLVGNDLTVGGVDGDLKAPYTVSWSGTVERQITPRMVASIGFVGSHSGELQHGFAKTFANSLAPDINVAAGNLLQHLTCPTAGTAGTCTGKQVRPNSSFGTIYYGYNGPRANYDGLVLALKGRFAGRGFITASYTYAHSNDNTTNFPIELPLSRYYGPSVFDVRDSFNLGFNYNLPGLVSGEGVLGRALSGWNIASDVFLQSGEPYTAYSNAPLLVDISGTGQLSYDVRSGDFIADGDNNMALPNVSSYHTTHSRQGYIHGVFNGCTGGTIQCGPFSIPQFAGLSGAEGSESVYAFRNPGYAEVDSTLRKVTTLKEGIALELRLDYFNLFNRVNLSGVDGNSADSTFGKVTGTASIPRQGQIGARLTF